ncbi:DUF1090 domain-containing protein [Citrobacter braakii]|nr:DUF1090 domain-containing protein [Citrobacter braakii]QXC16820.1 DUF1090 domain-containing protein [Citrobacter braakii]
MLIQRVNKLLRQTVCRSRAQLADSCSCLNQPVAHSTFALWQLNTFRQLPDSSDTCATSRGLIIYRSRTYADSSFTNNPLQLMTSMKPQFLRVTVLAGLLYSFMVSGAMAGNYRECEYKRRHLEYQLEYAQAYNNIHRMAGLQRALRHIDEYCTDGRLPKQKDRKVANKQRKVTTRQYELEQARISGKSEKIADRQAKLAEAREELAQARAELNH